MKPSVTLKRTPGAKAAHSLVAPSHPAPGAPGSNLADDVAIAAYYKAQARGFMPGGETADWLAAEAELSHSAGHPAP